MKRIRLEGQPIGPNAWFIDVPGRFAYHRSLGIGFGITFLPAELATDVIGVGGFKAVPALVFPASDLTQERVTDLAHEAIEIYVRLLRHELERTSFPHPTGSENLV